jgi:hypothetical protein|tara:strand:- start:2677 stop:2892 length:216 start_codon:yes stop_codon:yes gene_type:complete
MSLIQSKGEKVFTLQELTGHKQVLEDLIDSPCLCANNPKQRENIVETLQIAHAMLDAVTTQLEKQSLTFTP